MSETRQTFGAWLTSQKKRQDQVGMVARHWDSIKKDHGRVRSIPGIEQVLAARGDLTDTSEITPMWAAAKAEYENGPQQAPSPVQAVQPTLEGMQGIALTGDSSADLDRAYRAATGQDPPPPITLSLISDKLDWLHTALMSPPGTEFPPWPGSEQTAAAGQAEWTWDQLHEYADHEAEAEG